MTLCNMSIEGGARAGLVAPDETTFAYLKDRDHAPQGEEWDAAVAYWRTLPTDEGATFDKEVVLDAASITPHVTWGTNPAQVAPIAGNVPDPEAMSDPGDRDLLFAPAQEKTFRHPTYYTVPEGVKHL